MSCTRGSANTHWQIPLHTKHSPPPQYTAPNTSNFLQEFWKAITKETDAVSLDDLISHYQRQ